MEIRVQLLTLPERHFFACVRWRPGMLFIYSSRFSEHSGHASFRASLGPRGALWSGGRHVWRQVVVSECGDSCPRFGVGTNITRSRPA